MKNDTQKLQEAYQTILEERLIDSLKKAGNAMLSPLMKKKPATQAAPAADPNALKQQAQDRFYMKVSDAAEQAGFSATEDDRLGSTGFKSKSTGKVVLIIFQTNHMSFYENNKNVGEFKLTYSDDDAEKAIAFMKGEKYVDPEDRPWGLHPSDPRR